MRTMRTRLAGVIALASIFTLVVPSSTTANVFGTDVAYTTDADFDLGTLVSVNHDDPFNDQLQLNSPTEPFPFVNIAASGRGTVVRVNTDTGEVVGEYRTAPEGLGLNPSRTTVDLFGNVWTGNREETGEIDGVPHGSAVKIGLVVGGTRVDAVGTPDSFGEYLAPPFGYSTCVDRDGDGLLRTSSGLLDTLDWPDLRDGVGGPDGIVEDAVDECILLYQRLPDAEQARHVSVDADNNVWVGGFPFEQRMFHRLDGTTGVIIDSFDARDFGCGGYGGLIDGNGVLWSIGWGPGEGPLLRYDPAARVGTCVNTFGGYGLGIDTNGFLWASLWESAIAKVSPDGVLEPGFPMSTWLPPTPASSPVGFASLAPASMNVPATMPASFQALAAPDEAPDFWAAPDDNWVSSMNIWTLGSTVSLSIDDGTGVVHTDSQGVDPDGNFNFNLGETFDLERGLTVTVTDGITIKTHVVLGLFVDGINIADDTVFGRAAPGTSVDVWVHDTDVGTTATADGVGIWSADFAGLTDITYASNGGSQQTDDDGDATGVWWSGPAIVVSPDDDWVGSSARWTPGTTVDLTIDDGGVGYSDSQIVGPDGYFNFNLAGVFDVQRGHTVTVTDGTTTKTHIVYDLDVTSIDLVADTVSGVATLGTDVDVWDHQGGGNVAVTPDAGGAWTADLAGLTDLTYSSDGNSQQLDTDGDATWDSWSLPRFTAAPDDERVASSTRWTPGTTVTMTIDDGGAGYADSQVVDPLGNFNFNLGGVFDLRRGHTVTVTDGSTTKTHTLFDLFVDSIDVDLEAVSGSADPGSAVDVWVDDGTGANVTVTADGAGDWTADFAGLTDLTYASYGPSQQTDDDGDTTGVWWATPTFTAAPDDNWVASSTRWTPGTTVALSIDDGGIGYTVSQVVDPHGNFNFNLGGEFDLQRGHTVTVTDGSTTKTHTLFDLFVDSINVTDDTVFGRAPAGTDVQVREHQGDGNVTVTADGSGNWVADFSAQADITFSTNGNSQQFDADGDDTAVFWAGPRFSVSPDHDWVGSMTRWTSGSTVSMTIEDGSGVVHSDSQTVDAGGNFNFNLNGVVDVERGHVVTVSDVTTTKTHEVIELFVDAVDIDADTVSGRGIVGTPVDVWVHGDGNVTVMPDGSGQWTADFSELTDLTYGVNGDAQQLDDDGDGTNAPWSVRNPTIIVYRDQGFMRGHEFEPGVPVSITIGGVEVGSVVTDEGGEFWFDHPFDIGQTVTADDGTTLKSHIVTGHTIGVVDLVENTASGTAEALSWVTVEIEGSPVNIHRDVQADAGGVWFTDFDVPDVTGQTDGITPFTTLYVWQTDDDGDNTTVSWQLPRVTVDVDGGNIRGEGFGRDSDVTISIDGSVLEPVATDSYGSFDVTPDFDLASGQVVTVVGPAHTKTLLLTDPQVTELNAVLDIVAGTAEPFAQLDVWAAENPWSEATMRVVIADGSGAWTADFSVPADGRPALDVESTTAVTTYEWDDDGDATVRNFGPPVQGNRGVAVTPIDNHVWVANSSVGTVTRLDNDGNVLAVIATGDQPTGVAIDAAGKVWVTNLGSDNAVRIDPNGGADGLGEVDLTVDLGEGASPYNYSDMTGAVVVGSTSPQGFWTVVQDSGEPGFEWGRITWNTEQDGSEPAGSAIVVEIRTADTAAGLGAKAFVEVPNGELFSSLGQFIEVRVTLKASPDNLSPVLSDIRVQPAVIEVDIDIKPGSYPNTIKAKRVTGVVPVAVLGSQDFDVMTIDVTTLRFGPEAALPAHDLTAIGGHYEDVDLDGFLDLVSHYVAGDIGLVIGETEACLTGATLGGIPIEGCDSVRMR